MHFNALMNAVVLERADHLEARTVADMGQPRILVAAEVALENATVLGAVKQRAPGFEFAHGIRRFLGVQLGHAPVVQILAAAHSVGEVYFPIVAVIHVAHGGGDTALRHHGVRFAE